MKKILFIVDMYYPRPRAVGVCVHNVALELIKLGYQVHVIAYKQGNAKQEEIFEDVFIHHIPMRLDMKMQDYGEKHIDTLVGKVCYKAAGIIRKIQKLILLPWFPLVSPLTVYNYYTSVLGLNRKYGFDCIIATYLPPETLFAGALIKKKLKNIKYGAYILDSLINQSGQKYLPSKLIKKLTWKFEKMVYETADIVYIPECQRNHYQADKYEKYRDKIDFLDTPVFKPNKIVFTNKLFDDHKIHLVYMGTLLKKIRSPDYLYRLFKSINESGQFQLHFYTRGSCEDDLLQYQIETGGAVIRHGFVAHSEVDNIIANSDFLINLGVANASMSSSKIFEYMATGKPIIYLHYKDTDPCFKYLDEYELSLLIKMDDHLFDDNVKIFRDFLHKSYGKTVELDLLEDTFRENMPIYAASKFDEHFRDKRS